MESLKISIQLAHCHISELLNKDPRAECRALHSVGRLVVDYTHILSHTWKFAIVLSLKAFDTLLLTMNLCLTFTVCSFPECLPVSTPQLHLSASQKLSILFSSISFFFLVSESWAKTGGPWQKVGWLVLQVNPSFFWISHCKAPPAVILHVCKPDGCYCCFSQSNKVSKCTAVLKFHPLFIS